jgi:hypothetical protein
VLRTGPGEHHTSFALQELGAQQPLAARAE